jgi:hypothetical protein
MADLGKGGRSILGAPVRVKDDVVDQAAAGGHGHLDRVGDQRGAHVVRDGPADHAP